MGSPNKLWAKNTRKKFSPEFFQKKSCSLNPVTPTRNCKNMLSFMKTKKKRKSGYLGQLTGLENLWPGIEQECQR